MKDKGINDLAIFAFALDQFIFHEVLEALHEIEIIDQPVSNDNGSDVGVIQGIPDFFQQIQDKNLDLILLSQKLSHRR